GSQGTNSYIVEGLGNPESFASCSHGAGRKMGRNEAIRTLSLEEEQRKLDRLGVVHAIKRKRDLDEAPSAYKNIVQVMADQEDLVKIAVKLWPLAVVKG
ncbi:MAG: RtcB family protein, partial [Clostridiales bacterium]|nr:RtcB family protein [Clostridiales bacterium]